MRQNEEFFEGVDLELLHIAKRLNEAQRVEELLSAAQINYLVEVDHYLGGVIFRSLLAGAFFYVVREDLDRALAHLANNRVRVFTETRPDSPKET